MKLHLAFTTKSGPLKLTFDHDQKTTEKIDNWFEVSDNAITISAEPITDQPNCWHPGITFLTAGQVTGRQQRDFEATFAPTDPTSRYQIGTIDVVCINDNYDEICRSELIISFTNNPKKDLQKIRVIALSNLQATLDDCSFACPTCSIGATPL